METYSRRVPTSLSQPFAEGNKVSARAAFSVLVRCNITLPSWFSGTLRFDARSEGFEVTMEEGMYAYNLFRSTQQDGLICAVPEERSVPAFVTSPQWQFGGRLDGSEAPLGFDREAAVTGVRFNGFYLFATFQKNGAHQ